MSNKVKTVIFDFDGVIVESMKNNFMAWEKSFREFNIPFDDAEYYSLEGIKPKEVALHFLKKASNTDTALIEKIALAKENHFKLGPKTELYPGVKDLITFLKCHSIKIGLVSGGGRTRILNSLEGHQIQSCFDVVVSADDVQNGKPHPEPFLKGLSMLGGDTQSTIVIENAPLGIHSAKKAGLKVIAIGTTLREKDLFEADYFCANHEALRKLLVSFL